MPHVGRSAIFLSPFWISWDAKVRGRGNIKDLFAWKKNESQVQIRYHWKEYELHYHKDPSITQLGNVKKMNFCNKFPVILQHDASLFSLLFSYSKKPCNFQ